MVLADCRQEFCPLCGSDLSVDHILCIEVLHAFHAGRIRLHRQNPHQIRYDVGGKQLLHKVIAVHVLLGSHNALQVTSGVGRYPFKALIKLMFFSI